MRKTPAIPATSRIVTLCGSSGALSAYTQILRLLPDDTGMVFVVLTHRRTGSLRGLVDVLSLATEMPVRQIIDRSILFPNHVYVIPPGKDLTTDGSIFRLVPMSKVHGWPDVFDIFLSSLAENTQNRAVTIILSGMGADGSAALRRLRSNGGLAFAQSDAAANSMPGSAVAGGNVDYFCSAADIGVLISILPPQITSGYNSARALASNTGW